eukprot:UN15853
MDFFKPAEPSTITNPSIVFNTEAMAILAATNIEDLLNVSFQQLLNQIDNFERQGSGWVLYQLHTLQVNMIEYDPLRASSYIELPKELKSRKGCINVKNKDQKCT